MALPGGRLAFERAIRRSDLPAPARHVALTIATWADVGTGVIPERFQPSISTIAAATGLSEATVKRHLGVLEAQGWLLRDRPEISRARKEHARTKYALMVPVSAQGHGSEGAMPEPKHGSERAKPMAQGELGHGSERAGAGLTVSHKSSLNSVESPGSTTTSPAEPVEAEPAVESDVTDGGGGGGGSDLRSTAIHIAASLDYQGKPPTRKQRQLIEERLLLWLEAGWSMDGLVVILDIAGQGVRHAPTVYALRLDPAEIPAPDTTPAPAAARGGVRGAMPSTEEYAELTVEDVLSDGRPKAPSRTWAEAQTNARQRVSVGAGGGTDGNVAGWMNLSRDFAAKEPHKPYSDDAWRRPATPEEAARYPWCGDLECHEATRMRDGVGDDGLPNVAQCHKCHPNYQPF